MPHALTRTSRSFAPTAGTGMSAISKRRLSTRSRVFIVVLPEPSFRRENRGLEIGRKQVHRAERHQVGDGRAEERAEVIMRVLDPVSSEGLEERSAHVAAKTAE